MKEIAAGVPTLESPTEDLPSRSLHLGPRGKDPTEQCCQPKKGSFLCHMQPGNEQ